MTPWPVTRGHVPRRCRGSSVSGLINDLIPFGLFLGEHHPEVDRLTRLERHHVEEFLAWNRTRGWRGRLVRDQQVSVSVVHRTVLTLRNSSTTSSSGAGPTDPFAEWCSRRTFPACLDHCLGPLDPTPTPLSCPPSAVFRIPLPAQRSLSCAGPAYVSANALDLELGCVIDYGATGTWLRVPLGKLGTERSFLSTPTPLLPRRLGRPTRPATPPPHPRTGIPTDFVFSEHGRRIRPGASARVSGTAPPQLVSPGRAARPCE